MPKSQNSKCQMPNAKCQTLAGIGGGASRREPRRPHGTPPNLISKFTTQCGRSLLHNLKFTTQLERNLLHNLIILVIVKGLCGGLVSVEELLGANPDVRMVHP